MSALNWQPSDGGEIATRNGFTYKGVEVEGGMHQLFVLEIIWNGIEDFASDALFSYDQYKNAAQSHANAITAALQNKTENRP